VLLLPQHVQTQLQGVPVDAARNEPSWAAVAWNTVRNSARRRLFATWFRTTVTALVSCAVVAVGVFAVVSAQRAPTTGGTVSTLGTPATTQALTDSTAPAASAASRPVMDPVALAAEGRRLATNRQLMLTSVARAQLTSGDVDPRITATLRLLLKRHMVQVTSFGVREPGSPLRAVTIDCIDELPIDARSKQTASVLAFFGDLGPELAPRSVRVTMQDKTTVIVATYPEATG